MKRGFLFILLSIIALSAFCNDKSYRQRNIIYVLDCTGSMNGFNGAPNIWQPTKDFLKAELAKEVKVTSDVKFTILPFQDKVLPAIHINPKNINWPQHEATLNQYIKNLTATNICDAWLAAERCIDQTCDNYIVLMTDGHDNIGGSANEPKRINTLANILRNFCGKYANTKGFYVELTRNATLPAEIKAAIDNCNDLYCIDATSGIPQFGSFNKNVIDINTRDLPEDIEFGFSNPGEFKASAVGGDNPFVALTIKGDKISRGHIVLHIESKQGDDINRLNKVIGPQGTDITTQITGENITITNPDIIIALHTRPIRSLNFKEAKKDGKISAAIDRTKPFLWLKGNVTDTLRWPLNTIFNEQAAAEHASAIFSVKSGSDIEGCTLLYNGNELSDSTIEVMPPADNNIIELIVPRGVADDEISLTLSQIASHNLDRINDARPDNASVALDGKVGTSLTLLEIITWCIIAIIILFLIIWFAFLRNIIYPKFKRGIITIQSPYFATVRIKGARMVVFTPQHRTQGAFDKLFKGRVIYHTNPTWTSEALVMPSGKLLSFKCPTKSLISDPTPTWLVSESYKIKDNATGTTIIELSIN